MTLNLIIKSKQNEKNIVLDAIKKADTYIHLSIDEINEFHLECDTNGLLFITKNILLTQKSQATTTIEIKDKLPRYWRHIENGESIPTYQYSAKSVEKLTIVNIDSSEPIKNFFYQPTDLTNKKIQSILSKTQQKNSNPKSFEKKIIIPDLEPNQYPNINKPKGSFLWARIIDNQGYIIGDTKGLGHLLKHLIYNCYIGQTDSGAHEHLQRIIEDLDNYSMDIGIYNIDFVEEKFRKDYYKYR